MASRPKFGSATPAAAFEPEMRAIRVTLAYVQDDSERMSKLLRDTRGIGAGSAALGWRTC